MATRLTYTEKWEDEWFIGLSVKAKVLYLFILDRCTNAGIWKRSKALEVLMLGFNPEDSEFLEISPKVQLVKPDCYFVPNFFQKQFSGKKETWRAKAKALEELASYGIYLNSDDTVSMGCQRVGDGLGTRPSNSNSNSNSNSKLIIAPRNFNNESIPELYPVAEHLDGVSLKAQQNWIMLLLYPIEWLLVQIPLCAHELTGKEPKNSLTGFYNAFLKIAWDRDRDILIKQQKEKNQMEKERAEFEKYDAIVRNMELEQC